jgi:hypothetical protein
MIRRLGKGMRLRTRRKLEVKGIITYGAPCSGGFVGTLPEGETLVVKQDIPTWASGAWLVPERYEHFELLFVPDATRADPEYNGYAVSCSFKDVAGDFDVIQETMPNQSSDPTPASVTPAAGQPPRHP